MNDRPPSVKVVRRFDAPAERVFDAWLDPKVAGRWLFATPTGKMVRVEIDARVGGAFVLTDRRGGEDVEHLGEFTVIDRPRRLAFSFKVPMFSPESTPVAVTIAPAPGGCELTLTQENILPEHAARTSEGWGLVLGALAQALKA